MGQEWLQRLMYATLLQFGIKNTIGAGQLSDFFAMLHVGTHMGISESTIRRQLAMMEPELARYQNEQEASATCASPEITVGSDEVYFSRQPILVLMDLVSGYLLNEQVADDRSFATWNTQTQARLTALKVTVKHAVSDRAKALIKLAIEGFRCQAGADLFHVQQDIGRWLSRALGQATQKAIKAASDARETLKTHEAKRLKDPKETPRLKRLIVKAEQAQAECEQAQTEQRHYRQQLSQAIHPFNLITGKRQREKQVNASLQATLNQLDTLATSRGVTDPKNRQRKIRKQLPDLACHVGVWWHWLESQLDQSLKDGVLREWIITALLPVIYWHYQQHRTKEKTDRTLYKAAWEKATEALRQHALTGTLSEQSLSYWQQWCEDKVPHFQRASSAVEGRNGCLAQMHHNGRGLTPQRLKAHTVLHNYWIRRSDGSTAAERFYDQSFPDVFEWLLQQVDEWPLPRKRKAGPKPNPLIGLIVPL